MIARPNRSSRYALVLMASVAIVAPLTAPASAWDIVHDPANYSENVLQAARALEQINNQITSLQNEAQMLMNQARDLTSLPHSSLQQIQQAVYRTQNLLGQVQGLALDVDQINQAFQQRYGKIPLNASDAELVAGAKERWQTSVGSLQDALRVQAVVTGNIDYNRAEMATLVGVSQGATGALQAAQAGNQLLALQSQQLSDLIGVLSANGRSVALNEAEQVTAAEQGREQRRRFLTPASGYQPGNARMFNN